MKAFVTGSTGLLGSNLVKELLMAGYQVKALVRSREKGEQFLPAGVELVIGDMENVAAFADALEGCEVLFHVAAYFREYFGLGDHWGKLEKINVVGTIELFTEAEKRGIKKVVHVSSSGVIGRNADRTPADENTPPDQLAATNLYFKSKVVADQAIAKFLTAHSLDITLILPTVMIGPQDNAPTAIGQAMIDVLDGKFPIIPAGGFEFVDVRDVAKAMITAVKRGKRGERYIISAGYHTMAEVVQVIGRVSKVPVPRMVMPYPFMLTYATVTEFMARFTHREPQIGVSAVRTMGNKYEVTAAKARGELGVTFRPFEESIRDEVNWFLANGYVHRPIKPTV